MSNGCPSAINDELGLLTVGCLLILLAVAITATAVVFHHWILDHPKVEPEEKKPAEPDPSLAVDDPHTVPLELVLTKPVAEDIAIDAKRIVDDKDDDLLHLQLIPAAVSFEPPFERTVERSELTVAVMAVKLREAHEETQRVDKRRRVYLRLVRAERRRAAEACLLVPEVASVLATRPVQTVIRHIQEEAA